MKPPPLRNDCFALPPGVDWVRVDVAQRRLREALSPIVETETLPLSAAAGRFLAAPALAARSNPPEPNAAVDGYGFAAAALPEGEEAAILPLAPGRAAAGAPYGDVVPPGRALRILTGASLPEGVDTVVLEEEVALEDGRIAFRLPVKPRANTRKAGEDVVAGQEAVPAGRRLRPQELALLSAVGLETVSVYRRLRVGVLSTGDELREAGSAARSDQIFDANRPMLLSLAAAWGYAPVDLGRAPDDRDALRAMLDRASEEADVILTSGGASSGDEDHMSAILNAEGGVTAWRIAMKPGRPLALGLWRGAPLFGLPGNPVAAFVCALIFGAPALRMLAGGAWSAPSGFWVPGLLKKNKKDGRCEYLRARLTPEGEAEVFQSEGSGRISGLSWSEGLVALDHGAAEIRPGDKVRYLPYAAFAE